MAVLQQPPEKEGTGEPPRELAEGEEAPPAEEEPGAEAEEEPGAPPRRKQSPQRYNCTGQCRLTLRGGPVAA